MIKTIIKNQNNSRGSIRMNSDTINVSFSGNKSYDNSSSNISMFKSTE